MSYLSRFAARAPSARVDERTRLNLPGYHGDAAVRVFVENTDGRRGTEIEPRIRLKISDCDGQISLWFELDTAGDRRNSLHKIATLIGALHRFEAALIAEAHLAATRRP